MSRGEEHTRTNLLESGRRLMLVRGFSATSVDEICAGAGVTKGGFFHYFRSKEDFGHAVLEHHRSSTQPLLQEAPFNALEDPLERLHGYLDLFVALADDPEVENSCLFGNLAQEVAPTNPALRASCWDGFAGWAEQIALELDEAKKVHPPAVDFDSRSLAEHFIAIYEGSLVLGKARGDAWVLSQGMEHFRRYLTSLFAVDPRKEEP